MTPHGFDRLRRRTPDAGEGAPAAGGPADPQGRRSLFSVARQQAAPGTVKVECSGCGRTSQVTPRQAVSLAMPSLHLPMLRRRHPSWMRCPACGRRSWVRIGLRL